jgi:hypothetical protein
MKDFMDMRSLPKLGSAKKRVTRRKSSARSMRGHWDIDFNYEKSPESKSEDITLKSIRSRKKPYDVTLAERGEYARQKQSRPVIFPLSKKEKARIRAEARRQDAMMKLGKKTELYRSQAEMLEARNRKRRAAHPKRGGLSIKRRIRRATYPLRGKIKYIGGRGKDYDD